MSEPISCVCGARLTCEPSQLGKTVRCPACSRVLVIHRADDQSLRALPVAEALPDCSNPALTPAGTPELAEASLHPDFLRTRELASPDRVRLARIAATFGIAFTGVGLIGGVLSCPALVNTMRPEDAVGFVIGVAILVLPAIVLAFSSAFLDRGGNKPVIVILVAAIFGALTMLLPTVGLGISIPVVKDLSTLTLFTATSAFAIVYVAIAYYAIRVLAGSHLSSPGSTSIESLTDLFRPAWIAANRHRACFTCGIAILLLQVPLAIGPALSAKNTTAAPLPYPQRALAYPGADRPWNSDDLFDAEFGLPQAQRQLALAAARQAHPLTPNQEEAFEAMLRERGRSLFFGSQNPSLAADEYEVKLKSAPTGSRPNPGSLEFECPGGSLRIARDETIFGRESASIRGDRLSYGFDRWRCTLALAHPWLKKIVTETGSPLTESQVRQLCELPAPNNGKMSFPPVTRLADGTVETVRRNDKCWLTPEGTLEFTSPEEAARQWDQQQRDSAAMDASRTHVPSTLSLASSAAALAALWLLLAAALGVKSLRAPASAQLVTAALAVVAWLIFFARFTPVLGSRFDPRLLSPFTIAALILTLATALAALPLRHIAASATKPETPA